MADISYNKWEGTTSARRGLGLGLAVETGAGDPEVEKESRSANDLGARAQKGVKKKITEDRENAKEKENEKDQKVALQTVHHPVEVAAVALVIRRKTKILNVSVGLAVEARKREERRDHGVRKETGIARKIGKSVQGVVTGQVLQLQDQEVKALTEKPKAVETRKNEMMMTAQIEPRTARSPRSQRKTLQVQV